METKIKKEYTGLKAEKIEFNSADIISTSDNNPKTTPNVGGCCQT